MEATAAQSGVSGGGESAGTQADLSPETVNVTAGESQTAEPSAPPSSKSAKAEEDPVIEIDGERIKLSELREGHKRRRELVKGSNQKFEEAAALRKQVSGVLNLLRSNTKDALAQAGIDPRQFAQQLLADELQAQQMTPQERQAKEYQMQLEAREQAIAEREKQIQEQARAESVTRWEKQFERSFEGALEAVGLPKTKRALGRMADLAESYLAAGADDVLFSDIAQQVKDELAEENTGWLSDLSEDAIMGILPPAVIDKIRKKLLAKVADPAPRPQPQQPERSAAPRQAKSQYPLSMEQARAAAMRRMGA